MGYLSVALAFGISGTVLAAKVPAASKAPPGVDKVKVDARTERVIKGALKYLASQQRIDSRDKDIGHWDVKYPLAMTGYALMAFMSTGNLPGEGPYGKEVSRGLNYLLQQINEDTGIYGGQAHGRYMYGHGVATIALAELYGQTRDPRIRKKLQSVVERIVASQCTAPGRHQGGWRYTPGRESDTSVSGWMVTALESGRRAGLEVPEHMQGRSILPLCLLYTSPSPRD